MCNADPTRFSPDLSFRGGDDVEIAWEPPLEPSCSSSTDCKDWPHSICSATLDGAKRCLCTASSKWDSRSLNCTQGKHAFTMPNYAMIILGVRK